MSRVVAAAVLVVLALALVGARGGDPSPARLDLELANASGIRPGTLVKVGGASVGEVSDLRIDDATGNVIAELLLEPDRVTPGRGTRAAISTVNLVGAKFVDLDPGDGRVPLEDGTRIPVEQIGVATELDEVLDVLDADTRTRLEILINEAGGAFRGRRADLRAAVRGLPSTFAAVNDLLGQLVGDNATLERVLRQSDALVADVTAERRALVRLVEDAGASMETVAARRRELRDTLRRAPGTLTELTGLLRDLDATARPLGPAARTLSATAPPLDATLAELPAFRAAAAPTLREATTAAPTLADLAVRARPTVRAARPVVAELREVVGDAAPVTQAADDGIEDLLGLLQGWARTIQARDALGHAFRGHVTITRDLIDSLAKRLPESRRRARGERAPTPVAPAPSLRTPAPSPTPSRRPAPELLRPLQDTLERPLGEVEDILDGLTGGLGGRTPGDRPAPTDPLLDLLLGR